MLLLYLVFQQFIWKPAPAAQPSIEEPMQAQAADPVADSLVAKVAAVPDSLSEADIPITQVTLQNEVMEMSFTNQGGNISQIRLKKFNQDDGEAVQLVPDGSVMAGLSVTHPASKTDLNSVVFNHRMSADSSSVDFWLGDEEAPLLLRRYTLDQSYGIAMQVKIDGMGAVNGLSLDFGAGIADSETYTKYKDQDYKFIYYANNEQTKMTLAKLRKKGVQGQFNSFRWAALRSKYFAIVLNEKEPRLNATMAAFANQNTGNPALQLEFKSPSASENWDASYLIYAGPADYDILTNYQDQMENVAERGPGWLRWLANLIASFLKFLHGYIPNYGLVIIIFSMLLSLILTSVQQPLTRKGMEANVKMQSIQPEMDAIRKRYPNDTNQQRIEMAKLQQEHGINMFGGCITFVPLLINMPILISLYNVLRYTLDMRNASFILWWQDLSLPDKYYALPILMALTMVVQSRFLKPPMPADGKMTDQQKQAQQMGKTMNWIMPVMMFFIFRGLPAGLVLYYTVYSIFSAFQQYRMQKKMRAKDNEIVAQ